MMIGNCYILRVAVRKHYRATGRLVWWWIRWMQPHDVASGKPWALFVWAPALCVHMRHNIVLTDERNGRPATTTTRATARRHDGATPLNTQREARKEWVCCVSQHNARTLRVMNRFGSIAVVVVVRVYAKVNISLLAPHPRSAPCIERMGHVFCVVCVVGNRIQTETNGGTHDMSIWQRRQ